jgi:hypothetical protein
VAARMCLRPPFSDRPPQMLNSLPWLGSPMLRQLSGSMPTRTVLRQNTSIRRWNRRCGRSLRVKGGYWVWLENLGHAPGTSISLKSRIGSTAQMQGYQSDAASQFFHSIVSSTSSKILDAPRGSDDEFTAAPTSPVHFESQFPQLWTRTSVYEGSSFCPASN